MVPISYENFKVDIPMFCRISILFHESIKAHIDNLKTKVSLPEEFQVLDVSISQIDKSIEEIEDLLKM